MAAPAVHVSLAGPGEEALKNPNIMFFIERSKNKNLVIYEGMVKDGKLDHAKPIDAYWLDVDPAYQKKKREKGIKHDRDELGMLDNKMAYGVKATPTDKEGEYKLTLVALPDRHIVMKVVNGLPKAVMIINGIECYLTKISVNSTDRWTGLPKVNYVDLFGKAAAEGETGKEVTERIIPK